MKLLDRKTVNTLVTSQRKSQIDEGVALAKRIDALRVTLASLEAQQASFTEGMQNELRKKTQPLHEELGNLTREVLDLKEQRKALLKPLNEEWERVRERERVIQGKEIYLDERLQLLSEQEAQRQIREKELVVETQRLVREREAADENLKQAEEIRERAEQVSRETEATRARVLEELVNQEELLDLRDESLAARERELDIEKKSLALRSKELDIRQKQLEDREATLARNITRLQNGKRS